MIAVITYDHPHRKTQDLLCKLILRGYIDIDLIVLPYVERANFKPLFPHRPTNPVNCTIEELAERLMIRVVKYINDPEDLTSYLNVKKYDAVLIGGAGFLPHGNIINSHPGYLPNVRGLDALKWAILEGQPIGVTTYFIGEDLDTGKLIEQRFLQLKYTDNFDSIAARLYDLEINMLVDAIEKTPVGLQLTAEYPVHRRMSHEDEIRMQRKLKQMIERL
jgi:hypothetical protein